MNAKLISSFKWWQLIVGAVICVTGFQVFAQSHSSSFYQAKQRIYELYEDRESTFYCNCSYSDRRIEHGSCGMKRGGRFNRTEIEHVVPASLLGGDLECWREGGRKACERNDEFFEMMSNDLNNLRPTVGGVNLARSNYQFGNVPGEQRDFGQCDFEVSRSTRVAEPPATVRGEVARTYLYMSARYQIPLKASQIELYKNWSNEYPPSRAEIIKAKRIGQMQGSENCFVTGCSMTSVTRHNNKTQKRQAFHQGQNLTCESATKQYCKEMNSCEEAQFHLSCGVSSLDGDGDGVPCEAICN